MEYHCRSSVFEEEVTIQMEANDDFIFSVFESILVKDTKRISELLTRGELTLNIINSYDYDRCILGEAAQWCNLEMVKILVEFGADVNLPPGEHGGNTPLMGAASNMPEDGLEIARYLLESGADVNEVRDGISVLDIAAERGNWDIYNYLAQFANSDLLTHGPPNAKRAKKLKISSRLFDTVLNLIDGGGLEAIKQMFAERKLNSLNVTTYIDEISLLVYATDQGQLEIVRFFLESGADPNYFDGEGYEETALMSAAAAGHLEIVRLLIESGGNIREQRDGSTALDYAAREGHQNIVDYLSSLD